MKVSREPIENAIYRGIVRGIQVALQNKCYRAVLVLIYSGIDAMANLTRPDDQVEVEPNDFTDWVTKYIEIDAEEQVTPEEFYGARCGVLHTYGVESRKTRHGKARKVGYMDKAYPPVRHDPTVSKDMIMVSIPALADAFFQGVEEFLRDLHAEMLSNSSRKQVIESRLRKLLLVLPRPGITQTT